ncbi:phosphoenolpyruvate synthase [Candidatus Gottesmanbacteria bacterium]|nr:phosphoenolpyruvate synthase [Candidatus Gottesmanbacteria bacterium]
MRQKFVVWFKDVGKEDVALVGGKGANLGEMTQAGFPVPPGFIVTAHAYNAFLDSSGIKENIRATLQDLNVSDSQALERAAKRVQHIVMAAPFPAPMAQEIIRAYFKLEKGLLKHPLVAVRSSATAEDLPTASFAGQQSTFLNVAGEANLIEKVKEAWASLFTARAIFYRATHHFDHLRVSIAIPIERMIQSDYSGVMFTRDPVTNEKKKIVIEAIMGLGEMIVQGAVTPDHYEVDKTSEAIIGKDVHVQERMMIKVKNENNIRSVPKAKAGLQKLTDTQIVAIARLGAKLEKHYYFPQDVEWAVEKGKIYIVQTRPITTLHADGSQQMDQVRSLYPARALLAKGDPASPGIGIGPVRQLHSPKEIGSLQSGDVLVAEMTSPDYVPAMRKAVAIVTERGGRTSHAAIVSRELGIPAVVGAAHAMTSLREHMVVSVNGSTGEIYKGSTEKSAVTKSILTGSTEEARHIKTATKVYVNLAEPSRAGAVSRMNVDGVGLLRAEFMMAGIGVHPKKLIADGRKQVFVQALSSQIESFCQAFALRPVVYRTTDFKTNEYRSLSGGKAYEPEEPNPLLGYRGAARYIADPTVFELELEAIKTVRNKMGYKNLWLMIPFVRTPKELLEVKRIIAGSGLLRTPSFKLWLMVEIPTNVIRLEDFLEVGIDGVSIGSNDLTMLITGTDRDNSEVRGDFSELDPSVLWAFEHVIKTCLKHKVTSSMCGQAPSDYPDLVEKLVQWGITSVSVNPDAVDRVRETIYRSESRLVGGKHIVR